jgi:hypothetical protein
MWMSRRTIQEGTDDSVGGVAHEVSNFAQTRLSWRG